MKLKFRQAVISVYKALDDKNNFSPAAAIEIIFRQPYNNFGLAFSFGFSKSFFAPFATCNLSIENPSSDIADAFIFDTATYKRRPLIEIRAGYTEFQMTQKSHLSELKSNLSVLYIGHPTFSTEDKIPGGRKIAISLSDMSASGRTARISKLYKSGRTVISIIEDLVTVAGISFDLSALGLDPDFVRLKIENDLFFNNQQIITQILPSMANNYGFKFFVRQGDFIFIPTDSKGLVGELTEISAATGMVEHPTSINWVHWKVKTFFGRPKIFSPGDWVRVRSNVFSRQAGSQVFVGTPGAGTNFFSKREIDNTLDGLIIEAKYNFNDDSADIEYIISGDGQPVNANPILNL